MRHALFLALGAIGACATVSNAQVGGVFDLGWHTMDGGGITVASGGSFTLAGSFGQHDASDQHVGGSFTLEPGFWSGVVAEGPCNVADLAVPFGVLDFSDVIAFLVAFGAADPAADLAVPFGVFDFSDVIAFLSAFGAGCP